MPRSDECERELDISALSTAVASAVALRDLYEICHYYPDAIREDEARTLHQTLVANLELALEDGGFEDFKEFYKTPEFDDPSAEGELTWFYATLLLWHPGVRVTGEPPNASPEGIEEAMGKCQEAAAEPVRDVIDRLVQVMLYDCTYPTPSDDASFADPLRFLKILGEYWDRCRSLIIGARDAHCYTSPHSLFRLIMNLRARMDGCFHSISHFRGADEAAQAAGNLVELLLSGDAEELSVVPEWTTGQVLVVDRFLQGAQLRFGTRACPLTRADKMFLEVADKAIGDYRQAVDKAWARVSAAADERARAARKSHTPTRAADFLLESQKERCCRELRHEGESMALEFKSTLRWDIERKCTNKALQLEVMESLVAFLNTRGGTVLIGVADDGSVFGLEHDLKTFKKRSTDVFEQTVMNLFAEYVGAEFAGLLALRFEEDEGKTICRIAVDPAPGPAYLTTAEGSEFIVRVGSTDRSLDAREAGAYIKRHWG